MANIEVGIPGTAYQGPPGPPGEKGDSFKVDQTGTLAGRAAYNASPKGFSYFATDIGSLYFKNSATSSDWTSGIPFGKGDKGDTGNIGPQGIQGVQGVKGDTGNTGSQGPAGLDGRTIHSGTSAPSSGLGQNGDVYINTQASTYYVKSGGAWGSATPLVGPQGTQGIQGVQGTQGVQGSTGATGAQGVKGDKGDAGAGLNILGTLASPANLPASGTAGDAYLISGDLYVWDGDSWANVGEIQGPPGESGSQGIQGPAGPTGAQGATGSQGPQGVKGDTGNTGATGAAGADGKTVRSGTGSPSSGLGQDGDFYVDTQNSRIYGPKSGTWGSFTSLVGPQGPTGNTGATGAPGAAGKTILNGSGVPGAGVGVDGDFYLDTTNSRLYGPKSGTWGSYVSLIGPQGAAGSQGPQGNAGATGAIGATGADGKTVRNGSGAPSNGLGVDGDFYIDTTNSRLYGPKASGAWGSFTSLVGPQGATGAAGSQGPQGIQGATGAQGPAGSDATVPDATETVKGKVELATSTEVQTGTDTGRAVTPAALKSLVDQLLPAGTVQMSAASATPSGWLICDGSAQSRTTYAALFAAIGTAFGAGNGSTTFNLPDMQGRSPMGAGSGSGLTARTRGQKVGSESVSLAEANVPDHEHQFSYVNNSQTAVGGSQPRVVSMDATYDSGRPTAGKSLTDSGSGSGTAHENVSPVTVVGFIIKT